MQPADQSANSRLQLSLAPLDAPRLLEVYVKRSLSLNDGSATNCRTEVKPRKWVTLTEKRGKLRKPSSDVSAHLGPDETQEAVKDFRLSTTPVQDMPPQQKSSSEQQEKPKKGSKKSKRPSFFKSFLGLFSRKLGGKKDEPELIPEKTGTLKSPVTSSCLPTLGPSSRGDATRSGKSLRRRHSRRRISFKGHDDDRTESPGRPSTLDLSNTDYLPERIVSVEPRNSYYEKMSEELQKMVNEVKDSPTRETHETVWTTGAKDEKEITEIIVSLLKQQGDAIDKKLQENDIVGSFSQMLSYGSFQQLADHYVEMETPACLTRATGAPELVKFAFTLDFTARMAGLSSQTVNRIMGFGNQYLQDRFTQMTGAHMPAGIEGTCGIVQTPW